MEKLFVIKVGGNILDDPEQLDTFLQDFAAIPKQISGQPVQKILVHGGGKIATQIGEKLGIASQYIDGRRITDAETISLVTMVYGGLLNKNIVASLQALQCNAIGVTGADANLVPANKRPPVSMATGQPPVDFGFVGDIDSSRAAIPAWCKLFECGLTPVVAPLTHDGKGQLLNTNADTVASFLATSLSAYYDVRLVYCFEKKGILENVEDDTSVIRLITKDRYRSLRADGKLFAGILPKIDNAFNAITNGVQEVLIGHAGDLLRNITIEPCGTLITP